MVRFLLELSAAQKLTSYVLGTIKVLFRMNIRLKTSPVCYQVNGESNK